MMISEWYAKIYMQLQPYIFIRFQYAIAFLYFHFNAILWYLQSTFRKQVKLGAPSHLPKIYYLLETVISNATDVKDMPCKKM